MIPGSRFSNDRETERRRRAVELRQRIDALRIEVEEIEAEVVALPQPGERFPDLMRRLAKIHRVSVAEIRGNGRAHRILPVRFELYWAGYVAHGMSMPQIGRLLRRDHTSVLHGWREVDAVFQATFGVHGEQALAIPEEDRRAAILARVAAMRGKAAEANRERTLARAAVLQAEARG